MFFGAVVDKHANRLFKSPVKQKKFVFHIETVNAYYVREL